ncbi:MAG: hypothetical protein ABIK89_24610, partial [Planctomycetota bacterium]
AGARRRRTMVTRTSSGLGISWTIENGAVSANFGNGEFRPAVSDLDGLLVDVLNWLDADELTGEALSDWNVFDADVRADV